MTKTHESLAKLKINDICIITYNHGFDVSIIAVLHEINIKDCSYIFKIISINPINAWKIGTSFTLMTYQEYETYSLKVEKIEDKQ